MLDPKSLALYLCTDRVLSLGRPLLEVVEEAIAGGITMLQLREKEATSREFYELALQIRELTKRHNIPLVINDRLDIALVVGADGLHIGQSDLPLEAVRRIAGKRLFVGVSASRIQEAKQAEAEGADYLGVGAVFPTGSKADAGEAIGLEGLRAICSAVTIPVVGIGGLGPSNAAAVMQSGALGIAVISAILSQQNVRAAAQKLKENMNL